MIKSSPSTPAKPASHEWLEKSTLAAAATAPKPPVPANPVIIVTPAERAPRPASSGSPDQAGGARE